MVKKKIWTGFLIIWLAFSLNALASDWPRWRGPFQNGSSDEKNLPASWSEKENIKWITPLPGPSGSTPIICAGRIFVSSADANSKDLLALCCDAKDGKEMWRKKLATANTDWPKSFNQTMTSPSPVTDGKNVFFLYGSGTLVSLDYAGNILWQREIEKEFGNLAYMWGYSSSPMLYRDKLYVFVFRRHKPYRPPESESPLDSFFLALDPKTGNTLWKQPRTTDAQDESLESYTTAITYEGGASSEIIILGSDHVTGHDSSTGKELWRYGYSPKKYIDWRTISSPIIGEGLIFGCRPKGHGLFAIKTGGSGILTDDHIAWKFDGPTPDCSTPLFYKGHLYVLDGMKHGKVVTCLDPKTGQQLWQGKIGGKGPWRASLTASDGKIYCINETGEVVVLAAGDKQFKILFQTLIKEKPIHSSIAIANGHLFIRTAKNLYCIGK